MPVSSSDVNSDLPALQKTISLEQIRRYSDTPRGILRPHSGKM